MSEPVSVSGGSAVVHPNERSRGEEPVDDFFRRGVQWDIELELVC